MEDKKHIMNAVEVVHYIRRHFIGKIIHVTRSNEPKKVCDMINAVFMYDIEGRIGK